MSASLSRSVTRYVKECVSKLFDECTVVRKSDGAHVRVHEFLDNLESAYRCSGLTANLQQCPRQALDGSGYCRVHYRKNFKSVLGKRNLERTTAELPNVVHVECIDESSLNPKHPKKEGLRRVFIGDSFYWTDEGSVYDLKSFDVVGVCRDGEYTLSDDLHDLVPHFESTLKRLFE